MKTRIKTLAPFGEWVVIQCNALGIHQKEIARILYTGESQNPVMQERQFRRVMRGDTHLSWDRHVIPTINALAKIQGRKTQLKQELVDDLVYHLTRVWREE